ncbi:MAG: type II secretion system F family protein [Pseudomonadota bacterium]
MTFEKLLPPGVTPEDVIIFMTALTAAVSLLAIWSALLHRDPAVRRARVMASQRDALRSGVVAPRRKRAERQQTLSMMRQTVERLQLMRTTQAAKISKNLARAGWRSKDALVRYLFLKIALPFVFGGTALFVLFGIDLYQLGTVGNLVGTLVCVIFGAYAPDIVIKNAAQKREDKIRKALPDALDLMVICAEAGLSLDATTARVADELAQASPEISDEFGLTSLELGFLPERRKALENMAERCTLSALRGMVNTLMQSEKYGTPLAQSLRVLSQESRDERMLRAEEKAARLPALLTVPMIVFILPPLFIVLLGPAILDIMDNFHL